MHLSVDDFWHILKTCRSKETAMDSESRSEEHPSYSQCFATALVARDELWLSVCVERLIHPKQQPRHHFFNKDADQLPIRLCEEQFNAFPSSERIERQRERTLSDLHIDIVLEWNPLLRTKYELLSAKVKQALATSMK